MRQVWREEKRSIAIEGDDGLVVSVTSDFLREFAGPQQLFTINLDINRTSLP